MLLLNFEFMFRYLEENELKRRRLQEMRESRTVKRKAEVRKPQQTNFVVKLSVVVLVGAVAVTYITTYLKSDSGGGAFEWLF